MRVAAVLCSFACGVLPLLAQTADVGTGAPSDFIRGQFVSSFNRGSFPRIAALPPAGPVRRLGASGLIQEFNDSTRTSAKLALIRRSSVDTDNADVYQVLTDLYTYYSSVGAATAGYPTTDTQSCPASACVWQLFDSNYALFAWSSGANDPQTITVRDPFYTRWLFFGGTGKLGPAVSAETNVTSSYGSSATAQTFTNGVLYNITSGALNGRLVSVRQPVYTLYAARGAESGSLGLPTGDEQTLAGGRHRQTFESASIEYDDNSGPVLRNPVTSVVLRPSATPVRMNVGDTLTLQAAIFTSDGQEVLDRAVNFVTSNGRVVSIQANGATAVVRAVGGGSARVSASSEGKTSLPIDIVVSSQCCAVGEGAPSTAIQQAFLDAITRTRAQVRLPGPERVRRAGAGYVQEFQGADPNSGVRYLLTISDRSAQAFIVSGALLARYEELGGPAGTLGFPTSDADASGRQLFEGGALAGTPVHLVSGAILTRWAQAGYQNGFAGMPLAEAIPGVSFTTTVGISQEFAGGLIVSGLRGAFFVRGPAAAAYKAQGGIAGVLGLPLGDEAFAAGLHKQEFEGGTLEYPDGGTEVRTSLKDRRPAVTANPSAVLPGSRLRLAVSGFPDRATLRVSVSGQPDFIVPTQNGAYSWDALVASGAQAGTVTVRAVDTASGAAAQGSYTIRTPAQARIQLSVASGDAQTGPPGSLLAAPLRITLKDDAGAPVSGVSVRFTASPGASVSPETAVTDSSGIAETRLQLPSLDGVALVTAEAAGRVVTFSARSAGSAIVNFPKLMLSGSSPPESAALLAAAASIIRYGQLRGDFKSPNGVADAALLTGFLNRTCFTDSTGVQTCDGFLESGSGARIMNLWRLGAFVGGGLDVSLERTDISSIRALVAAGSPVLLALTMKANDRVPLSHFVVATGTGTDGGIVIYDPSPGFARSLLADYLNGFVSDGPTWKATISGAVRLLARNPGAESFVVISAGAPFITSRLGDCGLPAEWPDLPAGAAFLAPAPQPFRVRTCDGAVDDYQLDIASDDPFRATVFDLADGGSVSELRGSGAASFHVFRSGAYLGVIPQETVLTASGVVNAATYTPDIAPGGLISIFGSGLARTGSPTRVEAAGRAAAVVFATPFQINAQVPPDLPPGNYVLKVEAPYGSAEQSFEVRPVAPAIFRTQGNSGVVLNQNGTLNTQISPARRGEPVVIYATGLGATSRTGSLDITQMPVTVVIGGQELQSSFAGLTPGFVGLYQVNVVIPVTFQPGLGQNLRLLQGTVESRPVDISVQ